MCILSNNIRISNLLLRVKTEIFTFSSHPIATKKKKAQLIKQKRVTQYALNIFDQNLTNWKSLNLIPKLFPSLPARSSDDSCGTSPSDLRWSVCTIHVQSPILSNFVFGYIIFDCFSGCERSCRGFVLTFGLDLSSVGLKVFYFLH